MSTNLLWHPVVKTPTSRGISTELKLVLRKTYGLDSLSSVTLGTNDIPTLLGVAAVGGERIGKSVEKLIAAIDRHGSIFLEEQW